MKEEIKGYLAEQGRKGGSAKTEAKTEASRANGKKGGRPPKIEEFYWDTWDEGRVSVKIGRSSRGELWVNWGRKWERLTRENLPDAPTTKENFGVWQSLARDIEK